MPKPSLQNHYKYLPPTQFKKTTNNLINKPPQNPNPQKKQPKHKKHNKPTHTQKKPKNKTQNQKKPKKLKNPTNPPKTIHNKTTNNPNITYFYFFQFQFVSKDKEGIAVYSLNPILLRKRQEGDRIDFGDFSKKLRRLFIDEKIPSQERANAIIGEQDGKIIFVQVADKTYLRKPSKHDIMEGKLYIEKNRNR